MYIYIYIYIPLVYLTNQNFLNLWVFSLYLNPCFFHCLSLAKFRIHSVFFFSFLFFSCFFFFSMFVFIWTISHERLFWRSEIYFSYSPHCSYSSSSLLFFFYFLEIQKCSFGISASCILLKSVLCLLFYRFELYFPILWLYFTEDQEPSNITIGSVWPDFEIIPRLEI